MRQFGYKAGMLLLAFGFAIWAGYWVSAQIGTETLRREIESQLTTLLRGQVKLGRASVAIRGGLFLEGSEVGVYPRSRPPHLPQLSASHISAEIDVLALLSGRLRLLTLVLQDPVFEIHRDSDGQWSPRPVAVLAEIQKRKAQGEMERKLDFLSALEGVSRVLLSKPIAANRLEVRNGRINLTDEITIGPEEDLQPFRLSIHRINGRISHPWLYDGADLRLSGVLVDEKLRPVPIRAEGKHNGAGDLSLDLAVEKLPLDFLALYLTDEPNLIELTGTVQGTMKYETHERRHGSLELKIRLNQFSGSLGSEGRRLLFNPGRVDIHASLGITPEEVELSESKFAIGDLRLFLDGAIERPLGPSARASATGNLEGLDLKSLRAIARSLPAPDGPNLEKLLTPVKTSSVDELTGSGTATISEWRKLLLNQATQLPTGFLLSAHLSNTEVTTGSQGRLSEASATITLAGDRLEVEETHCLWNGAELPEFELKIQGLSNLFKGNSEDHILRRTAGALPGFGTLAQILNPDREKPSNDPLRLDLRIDWLEHPVLRWPIADAEVVVEIDSTGFGAMIESATWADAPIKGFVLWHNAPNDRLTLEIEVGSPDKTKAGDLSEPAAKNKIESTSWATGRFSTSDLKIRSLRLRDPGGQFAIDQNILALTQVRANLTGSGKFLANTSVDLGQAEDVPIEIQLSVVGAQMIDLLATLNAPEDYATGRVHLSTRMTGKLRPQTPLLSGMQGEMKFGAREGTLKRDRLPLLLALAQASEGYNDLANNSLIAYDSMTANLKLEDGIISTRDFELEGPLRIYASGSLNAIRPPNEMIGVIGLFLFRGAGQIMAAIPLVKAILPGSERGLVGAYFQASGPLDSPEVRPLPERSFAEDLPDLLSAPYQILKTILSGGRGQTENDLPVMTQPTVSQETHETDNQASENTLNEEVPPVEAQTSP